MQRVDRVNLELRRRNCSPNIHGAGHIRIFGVASRLGMELMVISHGEDGVLTWAALHDRNGLLVAANGGSLTCSLTNSIGTQIEPRELYTGCNKVLFVLEVIASRKSDALNRT